MPNYYDSGEAASASAQQTTGAENGPTADTVGATTTGAGTEQDNDVQRLHRYKLPPPFFTGDYSQYEEWLFKLQAYLGLIDRDFDLVLQLAQVATRQIEDTDIRTHILDPTQASKAVDLSRDLHYILINICQGAAATVVRRNRYNANGCETLRLLHNRFSLPVGTRSVGYLTKLLEPTFNEAQFEEQFLQWEYDINRYEKDNGTALPDGIKIAILLNKTKGALQQHLQLRAGQITNYIEIRALILDYYKTISAFTRSTSAVGTNYNGGTAPMDVDNIWRKGRSYKGKGKGKKAATKEVRAKASTGVKDTTKDSTKAAKEIQQEQRKRLLRIQRIWIKQRLQRPRKLQQIKRKRKQQLHNLPSMWQARPLGTRLQSAGMAHRRRRRTTSTRTRTSRSRQQ